MVALPDAWGDGKVKGLCTRGGFVVGMKWKNKRLVSAKIRSTLGGVLRIRSYVPLKGAGLRKAEGNCPNALLRPAAIKRPMVLSPHEEGVKANIPQVYEYDLETEAGKTYRMNP